MIETAPVPEAGKLVRRLPDLWAAADLSERRRLLLTVLDAVYVDVRKTGGPISIRPKAAFEAVLSIAGSFSLA
jgi:site-specific DNA recombinase